MKPTHWKTTYIAAARHLVLLVVLGWIAGDLEQAGGALVLRVSVGHVVAITALLVIQAGLGILQGYVAADAAPTRPPFAPNPLPAPPEELPPLVMQPGRGPTATRVINTEPFGG